MKDLLLLDTNAVITLAPRPSTRFAALRPTAALAISSTTELEVRLGVGPRPGNVNALRTPMWITRSYRGIPVDSRVVDVFPVVVAAAVNAGQNPRRRIADLAIAATALAHDATLVTDDRTPRNAPAGTVPVRSPQDPDAPDG